MKIFNTNQAKKYPLLSHPEEGIKLA